MGIKHVQRNFWTGKCRTATVSGEKRLRLHSGQALDSGTSRDKKRQKTNTGLCSQIMLKQKESYEVIPVLRKNG